MSSSYETPRRRLTRRLQLAAVDVDELPADEQIPYALAPEHEPIPYRLTGMASTLAGRGAIPRADEGDD